MYGAGNLTNMKRDQVIDYIRPYLESCGKKGYRDHNRAEYNLTLAFNSGLWTEKDTFQEVEKKMKDASQGTTMEHLLSNWEAHLGPSEESLETRLRETLSSWQRGSDPQRYVVEDFIFYPSR